MFPVAPGAYGHPPRPPCDESKARMPTSSAATTLASPWPRVLCRWIDRPLLANLDAQTREQPSNLCRACETDGVGGMDRVDTALRHAERQPDDVVLGDDALDRASESCRETDLDLRPGIAGVAQRHDRANVFDDLVVRLADVGDRVWLADGHRDRQRMHAGVERDLGVAKIRHEYRDPQIPGWLTRDARHPRSRPSAATHFGDTNEPTCM